jgi:hypothetical protein
MPFHCTICGEESTRICVWCTKDTCANHLCAKCGRCSDCCECEVPLEERVHAAAPPVEEPTPMPGEPAPPVEEPTPMPGEPPVPEPEAVPVESAPLEPEVQA